MAPYAAPALLYRTGAGYAGSMAGISEEMMISLTETALYALNFSNIVVQGSDMVESTTGKNALRDALGDDLYRMVGQVSETGAAVTVIAGLSNPDYYVKNNQVAHFEQVPRAGEGGSDLIPDNARNIAQQIKNNNGTPPKGYKGGKVYQNNSISGGQKLPEGINYREYDVNLYVKGQGRGTERIVIGDDGSVWYTNNHYQTFQRVE